jgi:hypothetical protein
MTELQVGGAIVRKSEGHPSGYLFITTADGKEFFLGNLLPGMTRGDVKKMARDWLERRNSLNHASKKRG